MHGASSVISKLRPSAHAFAPPTFLLPFHRPGSTRLKARNTIDAALIFVSPSQLRCLFFDALASVGSHHHGSKPRRKICSKNVRCNTDLALRDEFEDGGKHPTKRMAVHRPKVATRYTTDELLGLVDFYDTPETNDDKNKSNDENEDIDTSHKVSGPFGLSKDPAHSEGDWDKVALAEKLDSLDQLLSDDSSTPENIYTTYQELPEPGVQFLDKDSLAHLLRRLSVMEHKTSKRTLAYLSVLDDFRKVELPIPRHAWNSAIHLGSTTLSRITDTEVEFALKTWKQMQYEAGIQGNEVTFNILFDVASKAGKYALAEMILHEMNARDFEFTRFTRVGLILYHGLKCDGDKVRQAYRDFVAAREVVDTTVLNCLITSLMSAGEPDAAHAVFNRMTAMSQEREGTTYVPKLWTKRRELGAILQYMAQQARQSAAARTSGGRIGPRRNILDGMQDMVSIAPDVRTCNILLRYYCGAGQLQRAVNILESMQEMKIIHNLNVFRDLFMGFAKHGDEKYSAWSAARLENVWQSLYRLLQEGDLTIDDHSRLMVISTLVAFRRVIGVDEAIRVYEQLHDVWAGNDDFEETFRRPDRVGRRDHDDVWNMSLEPLASEDNNTMDANISFGQEYDKDTI